MAALYDVEKDCLGWSVIDTRTGDIAKVNDVFQDGLQIQDADELAETLNYIAEHQAGCSDTVKATIQRALAL